MECCRRRARNTKKVGVAVPQIFLGRESVFPRFTVVSNARDQVGERAGGLGAGARRDEWLGERTSGLAC